mmetsp:Transcript_31291/g.61414  ORF Transcript_31291/g.61414 Transcript_31291/m.61414 type:complete len:323 (+) Transcript_31291:80-1048(+)
MAIAADRARTRSRSPPPSGHVSTTEDVAAAHALRRTYVAPRQSKFRVASVLRFVRPDGTEGKIEAVNAEPHDANIRGAICAERAALCKFQQIGAVPGPDCGSRITRVVCVTDCKDPIFPGPCCREFLTSVCSPDVEVVASGTDEGISTRPLSDLLPCPSMYRGLGQDAMKDLGAKLGAAVVAGHGDPLVTTAYKAAVSMAKQQVKQAVVFPVLFAAAVAFEGGRVHTCAELKGVEYGCTVDAVSLLLPEMMRARAAGEANAICVVQADHFGVAHMPFAAARSLLIEHGFGEVRLFAHAQDGTWQGPLSAKESVPHSDYVTMF